MLNSMARWGLLAAITLLALVGHAPQQDGSTPRSLVIVLRDMGGTPIEDVTILLFQEGQTADQFIRAKTDEDGIVVYTVRPGEYLVGFSGGWQGLRFIDLKQQNLGAMSNNVTGGFALYLDPTANSYEFRFTVGKNTDDELVPFYDLAEGLSEAPDPYLYDPETIGDEVSINPAGYQDLTVVPVVPTPLSVEERQAIREEQAQARSPIISTIVLIIALIFCGIIVTLMWIMLISQMRNATNQNVRDE
jgi:hypothetical protein